MRKYLFMMFVIALTLVSCENEGVVMFDDTTHYLYIPNKNDVNNAVTSFKFYPEENNLDVLFDVNLVGVALESDKTYSVEVVEDETTANPKDYTLEKEQTFHAGKYTDQLKITLHKTAHLDTETVKVTVRLVANNDFALAEYLGTSGKVKVITASVIFDNKLIKPLWWDDDIDTNYLGKWTATKYAYFIEYCDGEVLNLADYTPDEKYILAKGFKKYIIDNDLREDGVLISIPVY